MAAALAFGADSYHLALSRARVQQLPPQRGSVATPVRASLGGGVSGTVASESALRSAGTLLSRVRAPPPAPWPDGGSESLRSPCCGLAVYKNLALLG
ncbi:hypothetical protein PoB_006891500 [Plakobranchus ocellatus]|uniref:Uncharacterized protein n=1 Tax=Plakobranchus ocellatus TaxID=259542 RepID=A0AAV4DEH1_9GAST|nr:hypothetical protein PoB_006891500 [Plakobranchus ocellatus]